MSLSLRQRLEDIVGIITQEVNTASATLMLIVVQVQRGDAAPMAKAEHLSQEFVLGLRDLEMLTCRSQSPCRDLENAPDLVSGPGRSLAPLGPTVGILTTAPGTGALAIALHLAHLTAHAQSSHRSPPHPTKTKWR